MTEKETILKALEIHKVAVMLLDQARELFDSVGIRVYSVHYGDTWRNRTSEMHIARTEMVEKIAAALGKEAIEEPPYDDCNDNYVVVSDYDPYIFALPYMNKSPLPDIPDIEVDAND